jgi:hypothetical protein
MRLKKGERERERGEMAVEIVTDTKFKEKQGSLISGFVVSQILVTCHSCRSAFQIR